MESAETFQFSKAFSIWLQDQDLGEPRLFKTEDGKYLVTFGIARTPAGLKKWDKNPNIPDFLDNHLQDLDEEDVPEVLEYLSIYQAMKAGKQVYLITSKEELDKVMAQ